MCELYVLCMLCVPLRACVCAQQKQIDACHSKSIIGHSFFEKRVPYYRFRVTCINLFLLCVRVCVCVCVCVCARAQVCAQELC